VTETSNIQWFAYVRHAERVEYEALGWQFSADLGLPHGVYSALFVWRGVGEPVVPGRERVALAGDAE
jgi:hypothetical protein